MNNATSFVKSDCPFANFLTLQPMLNKQCYRFCYKFGNFNLRTFFISNIVYNGAAKGKMPKPGYYAVRIGKVPGVYSTWSDCENQVKGFPSAKYKKFPTLEQAKSYINEGTENSQPQVNHVINTVQNRNKPSNSNLLDPDIIGLREADFLNDWSFDEGVVPVITSTSQLLMSMPKITYPVSSKGNYYAVHRGKNPGVYRTWTECSAQIQGFRNPSYRKFDTEEEAQDYVRTGGIQRATKRELMDLEITNTVIKKRKLHGNSQCEYILQNPQEPVIVFTDGASSENGKKRSRAGIGVYWGENHPLNTSKRISGRQTNNRAEIYAAVHALNQAKQIGAKKVKLYTDSQFVIRAITIWINKWKENGWKLVTGEDVVNKEDLIALDAARTDLDVEWIYVKAHAENKGNEEADRLAVAGRNLLLEPANCSEFQTQALQSSINDSKDFPSKQFLLTNALSPAEEILSLVLPNTQEKKPFYAVYQGRKQGVYSTWTECEKQIKDFPKPSFKKFFSEEEAKEFAKSGKIVKSKLEVPECRDDEYVTIFTDGASSGNGTDEAKAGIGVYWGPGNPLNTSMRLPGRQTNNRAEIFAAVHALRQAKHMGIKNVRIYTDSKFVIDGITLWIKEWKKKDWKSSSGKPVINKNDFIALDNACQGLNIDWCYVKGHANIPGNVEADKLAVAGCNKSLSETIILT